MRLRFTQFSIGGHTLAVYQRGDPGSPRLLLATGYSLPSPALTEGSTLLVFTGLIGSELVAITISRAKSAGTQCASSGECATDKCAGGVCCDASVTSSQCTTCSIDTGACTGCTSGYGHCARSERLVDGVPCGWMFVSRSHPARRALTACGTGLIRSGTARLTRTAIPSLGQGPCAQTTVTAAARRAWRAAAVERVSCAKGIAVERSHALHNLPSRHKTFAKLLFCVAVSGYNLMLHGNFSMTGTPTTDRCSSCSSSGFCAACTAGYARRYTPSHALTSQSTHSPLSPLMDTLVTCASDVSPCVSLCGQLKYGTLQSLA